MDAIRYFKLRNRGAFVTRIHVNYRIGGEDSWRIWKPSGHADICADAEGTVDLRDLDIDDGSHVRLIAFVVAGAGKTADEEYIFFSSIGRMAVYQISGTTLISKLNQVHYG